jgi:hypothetical protein
MPVKPLVGREREQHIRQNKFNYNSHMEFKLRSPLTAHEPVSSWHKGMFVRCPQCNAEPWVRCRSNKGRWEWQHHQARINLTILLPDDLPESVT